LRRPAGGGTRRISSHGGRKWSLISVAPLEMPLEFGLNFGKLVSPNQTIHIPSLLRSISRVASGAGCGTVVCSNPSLILLESSTTICYDFCFAGCYAGVACNPSCNLMLQLICPKTLASSSSKTLYSTC
jgi:hypothetical protein